MIYHKEQNDFAKACNINHLQLAFLKEKLAKAYDQHWHPDGPNVDQINAFIAPAINTPEEAFFVAQVIMTDVFGTMLSRKS